MSPTQCGIVHISYTSLAYWALTDLEARPAGLALRLACPHPGQSPIDVSKEENNQGLNGLSGLHAEASPAGEA